MKWGKLDYQEFQIYHGYNTFTYSAAILFGPFGIKYHRCKSFGFYSAFKTDFEIIDGDYIITIGCAKSIGQNVNLFVGGGYDISFSEPVMEGGIMIKSGKFACQKKKIQYLTQAELNRIELQDFKAERLNIIRDIFVLCCYNGSEDLGLHSGFKIFLVFTISIKSLEINSRIQFSI